MKLCKYFFFNFKESLHQIYNIKLIYVIYTSTIKVTKPIINLLCNKSTITKRRKSDSELSVSNLEEEIKENKNIIDEENLGKNENFIVKVNKKNTTNLEDKNMSDKLKKFLSNIK